MSLASGGSHLSEVSGVRLGYSRAERLLSKAQGALPKLSKRHLPG